MKQYQGDTEKEKERVKNPRSYDKERAYRQEVRDNGQTFDVVEKQFKIPIRSRTQQQAYDIQGYDNYTQDNLEYGRIFQDDSLFHATPSMFKEGGGARNNSKRGKSKSSGVCFQEIKEEDPELCGRDQDDDEIDNEFYIDEEQFVTNKKTCTEEEDESTFAEEEEPSVCAAPRKKAHQAQRSTDDGQNSDKDVDDITNFFVEKQQVPVGRMYLDLLAYVVSGILLIYIMEQILQLGMYLGSK
jgi:hypothetical protein